MVHGEISLSRSWLAMVNRLLNEQNELQNRNLHINGLLNKEKVDIECL